ncbi:MAG: TetR/AcrR family transcriptional regulator [Myxococcales bacterium]|nr:TetR/AcrR family transcriptional regulator [Myxococcales bacterium]
MITMVKQPRETIRARVIEVAQRLLAERGIEGVNTNEVARTAGIGVGTFYGLFPDKHALADAVTFSAWEQLGAALLDAPSDASSMTRVIVDFAAASPERFRAAFGRPPSSRPGRPALQLSTRPLARRLAASREAGELDAELDAEIAARAWWAMASGTLIWWLEDPRRADREALARTLAALHPLAAGARRPG